MRYVVLPQAFRRMVPALVNEGVTLIKDSSLVSAIGLAELALAARTVAGAYSRYWEPYLAISAMYLVLTLCCRRWPSGSKRRRTCAGGEVVGPHAPLVAAELLAPTLLSSLPPKGALAADRRSRGLLTPTLLPSLPPKGALAADRQSRIRARPWVAPFHAGGGALTGRPPVAAGAPLRRSRPRAGRRR